MAKTKPAQDVKRALRAADTENLSGLTAELVAAVEAREPDLFRLLAQGFTQSPLLETLGEVRALALAAREGGGQPLADMLEQAAVVAVRFAALRRRLLSGESSGPALEGELDVLTGQLERLGPADAEAEPVAAGAAFRAALWTELAALLRDHDAVELEIRTLDRFLGAGGADRVRRRVERLLARRDGLRSGAAAASTRRATPGGGLPGATLIFPHTQKTGGTSLRLGLKALFGDQGVMVIRGAASARRDLQAMSDAELGGLDLVTGHFGFDDALCDWAPLMAKEPLYLGVVRDPVARTRSIYNFIGKGGSDEKRGRSLRVPHDPDINVVVERWLSAPADWTSWRHEQCRTLCGEPDAAVAIRLIEHQYLAVVVTGGLNDLIAAVARALSRPEPPAAHHRRSDSHRLALDPVLETRLRAHHDQDQKLFDWVMENQARLIARGEERLAALSG